MPLNSMTGFARETAQLSAGTAVFELKSVNGRALDIRMRLPAGLERLEPSLRALAQSRLKRGSLTIALQVQGPEAGAATLSPAFLDRLSDLRAQIGQRIPLAPSTLEGILSLRGAQQGAADAENAEDDAALLDAAGRALAALAGMRRAEGEALADVIRTQLDEMSALADAAAADPSLAPEAIVERLRGQIALLGRAAPELDGQRLHAEAALLATRADIREEVDRLRIHLACIAALLDADEPQGRKLDFLAQELNREANTLCSKANAASLTAIGIALKVVIDQFREQVQNVE